MSIDNLLTYYRHGYYIFEHDGYLYRRDSAWREIIPLKEPLRPTDWPSDICTLIERRNFTVITNQAFVAAMQECSRPALPSGQRWLGSQMQALLTRLHEKGFVHSIEIWAGEKLAAATIVVWADLPVGLTAFTRRDDKACRGAGYAAMLELNARLRGMGCGLLDAIQPSISSRLQRGGLASAVKINGLRFEAAERPHLAFSLQPAIFPPR
jgi:leucyl/phenylalanyl-tRNA--protein transferase